MNNKEKTKEIYELNVYFDGDETEKLFFTNKENAAAYGLHQTQDYDNGEYTITEQPICDATNYMQKA